jgi:biopolymer transport protein ExbD/biopolymer transport protein TolR
VDEWRKTPARDAEPDINVTPLVDVVLVLLIIFMVVTPHLEQDVQVNLPGVFHPDPDVEKQFDPIRVSVARAGEYYVDGEKYDLDGVIGRLAAAHAAEPERRIVLRADADLSYGDVRQLLARTQQVGFPGLALMVGEKHRYEVPSAEAPESASPNEGS